MQQAGRGKIAPLPKLGEIVRHLLKLIHGPICLSAPELPLQQPDVGVDMGHFAVRGAAPTYNVIGNLLQRLNLSIGAQKWV